MTSSADGEPMTEKLSDLVEQYERLFGDGPPIIGVHYPEGPNEAIKQAIKDRKPLLSYGEIFGEGYGPRKVQF